MRFFSSCSHFFFVYYFWPKCYAVIKRLPTKKKFFFDDVKIEKKISEFCVNIFPPTWAHLSHNISYLINFFFLEFIQFLIIIRFRLQNKLNKLIFIFYCVISLEFTVYYIAYNFLFNDITITIIMIWKKAFETEQ